MTLRPHAHLHWITGKGGVGKTTFACALGLALAKAGHQTLVAEIEGRGSVTDHLQSSKTGSTLREVEPNLHIVDINPTDALREFALQTLKFDFVFDSLLGNRTARTLISLIPSLPELVMLGKLGFHAEETREGQPRFKHIVVDLPATGHAIATFKSPKLAGDSVPAGRMRTHALDLAELLTNPKHSSAYIVTLPEEGPVEEAKELADTFRGLSIQLRAMVLNRWSAPCPPCLRDIPEDFSILRTLGSNRYARGREAGLQKEELEAVFPGPYCLFPDEDATLEPRPLLQKLVDTHLDLEALSL